MSKPRKLYTRTVYLFFAFLAFVTRGNKHCIHKKLFYGALILGIGGQFECRQKEEGKPVSLKSKIQKSTQRNPIDNTDSSLLKKKKPTKADLITVIPDCYEIGIDTPSWDSMNDTNELHNLQNLQMREDTSDTKSDPVILCYAETTPEYPGGDEARIKFLKENMNYPVMALKSCTQGTVYISFTINEDGSISNPYILRGIGYDCDDEVIRVLKLMPKWKPAKLINKSIKSKMILPIKFTLPDTTQTR